MNRRSPSYAAARRSNMMTGSGLFVTVLSACLLSVIAPVSHAQTGDPEDIFREAVEHYKQADYGSTIQLLEELQRSGYASFPVHYNLGNAYYKNGELAQSILQYERALLHDPGNEDVLHNLKVVRARTRDRLEPVPLLFFVRWWNDIKNAVTAETLFMVSVVLLWILAAALFVFFGYHRILIRRIALVSGILIAVLFFLTVTLYFARVDQLNAHRRAIVMTNEAVVRSTPDASGIESFLVHEGLKVEILETQDDFSHIRLEDGKTGWIKTSTLERI